MTTQPTTMKYVKPLCFIPVFALLMLSCEKMFMEADARKDPVSIFEEIWTFADRHYSFFDEKGVDWDSVYTSYRPQVKDDMGPVELFDLCAKMLYELRDGHVNLVSPFDRSRYWQWYLERPENFYFSIIERHYFKDRQRYFGPLQVVALPGDNTEEDILYVYYGSFGNTIGEGNLDDLIFSLNEGGFKGLIFDVRNNGGGDPTNGRNLAARFTDKKVFVGTNYIKHGPGHGDFRLEEVHIEPHDGLRFSGDVVVLTNRKSYSATTYFAQYMKALDQVTLVGDTTGGGGGLPAFRDLANGWRLRVSSTRFYNPAGESIEPGVPPHITAQIPEEGDSINLTSDEIIETAIELIRSAN